VAQAIRSDGVAVAVADPSSPSGFPNSLRSGSCPVSFKRKLHIHQGVLVVSSNESQTFFVLLQA
jgi:hypothetical protein